MLYQLLVNIIVVSLLLIGSCLTAGIIYGMMRLYRRGSGRLKKMRR